MLTLCFLLCFDLNKFELNSLVQLINGGDLGSLSYLNFIDEKESI